MVNLFAEMPKSGSDAQTAAMLGQAYARWLECFFQRFDRHVWASCTAHENVDRCEVPLWPGVDGDMALRQDNHTRHAIVRREDVEI